MAFDNTSHHRNHRYDRTLNVAIAPKILIISLISYLLNRLCLSHGVYSHNLFKSYLGDFLALPIFIPVAATIQSVFGQRRNQAAPCLTEILIYWVVFSLFFEIVAPQLWSHATGDSIDVIAYLLGGVCLWFLEGKQIWNQDCFPKSGGR